MSLTLTSPRANVTVSRSHREAEAICRVMDTAGNKPFGTVPIRGLRE